MGPDVVFVVLEELTEEQLFATYSNVSFGIVELVPKLRSQVQPSPQCLVNQIM